MLTLEVIGTLICVSLLNLELNLDCSIGDCFRIIRNIRLLIFPVEDHRPGEPTQSMIRWTEDS